MQKAKWFKRQPKVITVEDLQKKIDEDTLRRNNAFVSGNLTDSERWGLRCLELTNKFRANKSEWHDGNKPALMWN